MMVSIATSAERGKLARFVINNNYYDLHTTKVTVNFSRAISNGINLCVNFSLLSTFTITHTVYDTYCYVAMQTHHTQLLLYRAIWRSSVLDTK